MKTNLQIVATTIVVLFYFCLTNVMAKEYYISNNGNDEADGLTPNTSFLSISKLNSIVLKPGDKVYFKSGDRFTGTLRLKHSGQANNPIVISSYGGVEKPILSGAKIITGIKSLGNNLYEAPCKDEINYFYLNAKLMTIAREPNIGFFTMDGGGSDYLVDFEQKLSKEEIIGATARMRVTNWNYEYRKVVDFKSFRMKFDSVLFSSSFNSYKCKKGFGYYLDNKKPFLDTENECYWSDKDKKVYFISSRWSENSKLQGSVIKNGIIIDKEVSNIVIENLLLQDFTDHGIYAKGLNKNISVKKCIIRNIVKMGFFAEMNCSRIMLTDNLLYDILGTGIRLKAAEKSIIENNKMKRIGLIPGYGIDGINGAIGISVENPEKAGLSHEKLSNNNMIKSNYIDSTGYMSARMDGFHNVFELNVVKNGLLTMNDGGLLHTYGADTRDGINLMYTHSNIIRNNIFMNCFGNTESSANDHKINQGIYLDARSNKFVIENNIVINCGAGILLNDKTRDCTVRNNVLYGNQSTSLTIVQAVKFDSLKHWITNNTFFNTKNRKSTLTLVNNRDTYIEPGYIDSNVYVSPNEMFHVKRIIVNPRKWKNTREYTLEGWQTEFGMDKNSRYLLPEKDGKQFPKSDIFINESDKPKTIQLSPDFEYIDIQGNYIRSDIVLDALQCKIVLYRAK